MSASSYAASLLLLAATLLPLVYAAATLRRLLVPGWRGPLAHLSGVVLFLTTLFLILQVLGALGLFSRGPIVVACLATGFVAVMVRRRTGPDVGDDEQVATNTWLAGVAVVALALAGLPWLLSTWTVLHAGIGGADSIYYHLPFAARFAQSGHITPLHFAGQVDETPFDPENSELLHGLGMVLFHHDVLSPLINLLWFAMAALGAWCVGERRGVGPATLAAGALLLAGPLFVTFDAGQATNDAADAALLLAAVALVLNSARRPQVLALAALAAGLGLSNKLSLVVPLLALTVAVVIWSEKGTRLRTALVWVSCTVLTGSFWYLRNLLRTGSPLPSRAFDLGPVSLPHVDLAIEGNTVAGRIRDPGVLHDHVLPGLHGAFGAVWPLTLGIAFTGIVLALVSRQRILQLLAGVAVVSFAGYLVTPDGIGGPPFLFEVNLRFVYPAVLLGLILLPLSPLLAPARRQAALTIGLLAMVLVTQASYLHALRPSVVLVVAAVLVALAALLLSGRVPSVARLAIAGVLVLGVVTAGWTVQRTYLDGWYQHGGSPGFPDRAGFDPVFRWARGQSDLRIAVGGFNQHYPLYGRDQSNYVQPVALRRGHGQFVIPTTCRQWRRAINDGTYQYVVTGPTPILPHVPKETRWTDGDPAAKVVLRTRLVTLYRIDGHLDADACAAP